jgi:hypothetical protein
MTTVPSTLTEPKLNQLVAQGSSKGRNVSGRPWKTLQLKRASTVIVKSKLITWDERQAEKRDRQAIKSLQTELKEASRKAAVLKKERRLENEQRRAENQFKSLQNSVQTLNHDKVGRTLKAMSKKQLRQVKKTRLNTKTGVVEYVSAYAK